MGPFRAAWRARVAQSVAKFGQARPKSRSYVAMLLFNKCLNAVNRCGYWWGEEKLERETGFEPATLSLEG